MDATQHIVTTKIALTEQQRNDLAKALSIGVQFIPKDLGIVGMPKNSASAMGFPDGMKAKFSPALIMM